jgi:tRNA 2-thiouridine synthesizing protein E
MNVLKVLGEGVSAAQAGQVENGERTPTRRGASAPAPQAATPTRAAACPASTSLTAAAGPSATETRSLGGVTLAVDAEGFLADRSDWTPGVAEALASEAGIDALTDEHWRVIDFCRADAGDSGAAPGMRRITSQLGVPPRDLYRLFPGGPGILAARIAGLGKPKSCV